jgi:hypothetical protein
MALIALSTLAFASSGQAALWQRQHKVAVTFQESTPPDVSLYGLKVTQKGTTETALLSGQVRITNPQPSEKLGDITFTITSPDGAVLKEGVAQVSPTLLPKSGQGHFMAKLDVVPPQGSMVQLNYERPSPMRR